MFWLLAGVLCAVVTIVSAMPLFRRGAEAAPTSLRGLDAYRDQLSEVDRDLLRGSITHAEATAARSEIERRILALADCEQSVSPRLGGRGERIVAGAVLCAAMSGGVALYAALGEPRLPNLPLASRDIEAERQAGGAPPELEAAIAAVSSAAQDDPGNPERWIDAARLYVQAGRFGAAVRSYEIAMRLTGGDPGVAGEFGEALVRFERGVVSPKARQAFGTAMRAGPDPRSRYYLALADAQAGDPRGALDEWVALFRDSPADAPWLPAVRARIDETATALGVEVADLSPRAGSNSERPADLTDSDRTAPVRGIAIDLEARLERDPKDFRGWMQLARSYDRLGEAENAADVLSRAAEQFANAPFLLRRIAQLANELGVEIGGSLSGPTAEQAAAAAELSQDDRDAMIRAMVQGLADRLEENPRDWQGWMRLTRAYAVLGERESAENAARRAAEIHADTPAVLAQLAFQADQLGLDAAIDPNATMGAPAADADTRMSQPIVRLAAKLERNPANREGWILLGMSHASEGNFDEAELTFERASSRFGEDAAILAAWAGIRREAARGAVTSSVTEIFKRILALDGSHPEALWTLGVAAERDGDIDKARMLWRRLLDVLPQDNPKRGEIEKRLDGLG